MSTVVGEWEKEATKLKTQMKAIKIKLKMNKEKKQLFQQWMYTSNFAYNKTIAAVRNGHPVNFYELRNKLVTANTKKHNIEYQQMDENMKDLRKQKKNAAKEKQSMYEKQIQELKEDLRELKKALKSIENEGVFEWELETPKDVRAMAVQDVCKAYKTVFTNMKQGNIQRFHMGFRKKEDTKQSMVIPKQFLKNKEGKLIIGASYFHNEESASISMGKKTIKKYKNLQILHDCRMIRHNQDYWLCIPIEQNISLSDISYKNYCGVDPGIRTFMTSFGNQGCQEYEHDSDRIAILDKKLANLKNKDGIYKSKKRKLIQRKIHGCMRYFIKEQHHPRIRKRKLWKIEKQKENLINEIHWKTIHAILECNDIIFYGDIQSHNIVRRKKNRNVNRNTNNMKFYLFKQRLQYKSTELGKKVILVKENYTTKTCSFCGSINHPGVSKIYECKNCKRKVGRDVNAAKNILMKGILSL
jgi:putative transposase